MPSREIKAGIYRDWKLLSYSSSEKYFCSLRSFLPQKELSPFEKLILDISFVLIHKDYQRVKVQTVDGMIAVGRHIWRCNFPCSHLVIIHFRLHTMTSKIYSVR